MTEMGKFSRRGLTLTEVLVAGMVFLMIMLVAESIMNYVQRVGIKTRAEVEPRQQIRSAMTNLSQDLRSAAYIFEGFSGTLNGATLSVPHAGQVGDAIVFAIPEDDSADIAYAVCALYARPRSQADPNNPTVRELVYLRYPAQTTTPPNTPGAIDPATLALPTVRVFDAYIPTGAPTLPDPPLAVRIMSNGKAADLILRFREQPMRGPVVSERFETLVTMRNNV